MHGMEQSILEGLKVMALFWGPWLYLLISVIVASKLMLENRIKETLVLGIFSGVVFIGLMTVRDSYRIEARKMVIEDKPTVIESRKDLPTEFILTNEVKTVSDKVNEKMEKNRLENEKRKKAFEELIKKEGDKNVSTR